MSPKTDGSNANPDQATIYQQLCTSYHAIDDFRAKLLGFLPLATGTGFLFLFNPMTGGMTYWQNVGRSLLLPVGLFGFIITLGLFFYEIYGIRKCADLIYAGQQLEGHMNLVGPFRSRKNTALGFINEPVAAGIIYSGVLAAWVGLILCSKGYDDASWWGVGGVFVAGFIGLWRYDCFLRKSRKSDYDTGKSAPGDGEDCSSL
jgi:hypothetical protein